MSKSEKIGECKKIQSLLVNLTEKVEDIQEKLSNIHEKDENKDDRKERKKSEKPMSEYRRFISNNFHNKSLQKLNPQERLAKLAIEWKERSTEGNHSEQ